MGQIYYLYNGRFPSEKAHSIFVQQSCASFSELGHKTTLVVNDRKSGKYHMESDNSFGFEIKRIHVPDFTNYFYFKKFVYFLSRIFFLLGTRKLLKRNDVCAVITNELYLLPFLRGDFTKIYEMHDYPTQQHTIAKWFLNFADTVVVTNTEKKDLFEKEFDFDNERIALIRNGVDVKKFAAKDKDECRKILGLDNKEKIVLYTGQLHYWKGVDTLVKAAITLPSNIKIYVVGGSKKQINEFKIHNNIKREQSNIIFHEQVAHEEVPTWLSAADILVIPNTAKYEISSLYTSPMKLFEYLATGRAIIASRLRSIQDVVTEENVTFFCPDDPDDLKEKILSIIHDCNGDKKRDINIKLAMKYSWKERAKLYSSYINSCQK